MPITSTSTQADIVGQYLDNLGYDHSRSVASCQAFIQACRALLVIHPNDWQHGSHRITFQPALWRQEQESAQKWLNVNQSGANGAVKHLSFGGSFR